MRFTLRQLEVFAAVGRCESVSRAAAELSLSQSAASSALAELERQFDAPLFTRQGKRLALNELGRSLLPRAIELLDRAEEMEALLAGREAIGPLRIGATLTIGNYLATRLVGEFMRQHADCEVRLEVSNTAVISERMVHFELDIGMIEGDFRHPQLDVIPWVADELVVFAAPEHPLARRPAVSIEELAATPWVLREEGSGTRQTFDRAMHAVLPRLRVLFELEHTEAIKRVVESGLAIGCVSRLALLDAFSRGSLVPLPVPELDLRRYFHFLIHRQKYRTPGMLAFLALCQRAAGGATVSDEMVRRRGAPMETE